MQAFFAIYPNYRQRQYYRLQQLLISEVQGGQEDQDGNLGGLEDGRQVVQEAQESRQVKEEDQQDQVAQALNVDASLMVNQQCKQFH